MVLGPALGVGDETIALVEAAMESEAAVVLDADGMTSFVGLAEPPVRRHQGTAGADPSCSRRMTASLRGSSPISSNLPSKLERARAGGRAQSGAIVVLKGPDTVVAAPDGRAAIADNAPAELATAGAGDVLAGI